MNIFAKLLPLLLLGVPFAAEAACTGTGLCNPLAFNDLTTFLQKVLEIVAQIGFPIIVLFMVYIGFLYISASGNPDKIKKAHSYFMWAIVGALLILGAQALSIAIKATVTQLSTGVR